MTNRRNHIPLNFQHELHYWCYYWNRNCLNFLGDTWVNSGAFLVVLVLLFFGDFFYCSISLTVCFCLVILSLVIVMLAAHRFLTSVITPLVPEHLFNNGHSSHSGCLTIQSKWLNLNTVHAVHKLCIKYMNITSNPMIRSVCFKYKYKLYTQKFLDSNT
jgi:hypothetical protein